MKIVFKKIEKESIFCDEFKNLNKNNEIVFAEKNVAIIYGPNGTGKTSLAKVLNKEKNTKYILNIDEEIFTEKDNTIAHVIFDQNDRNIIQGSTEDFILGANIRREYDLKRSLGKGFENLYEVKIIPYLKNNFGISTVNSPFDLIIKDKKLLGFISDLSNVKSKGGRIDKGEFLDYVSRLEEKTVPEYDVDKFKFFVEDYKTKESAIKIFCEQVFALDAEEKVLLKVDENNEAVRILERFSYLDECVVCDHEINRVDLLANKQTQKKQIEETLSEKTKAIINKIIKKIPANDPFGINEVLRKSLCDSDSSLVEKLRNEIGLYFNVYSILINNYFKEALDGTTIVEEFAEYSKLTKEKPHFESEDIVFIEKFLNDSLDKKITLGRDADNNLKLMLGDSEFLNHDRKKLSLSNGEQNFLSIAFELLKAQKVPQDIIVLDDPISSFDSIYKNKIAFAILRILANKKLIITTHNTDLIKLLEHQKKNSFNLYYLNNTDGEENGVIEINENEIEILMYIPSFLELLRGKIKNEISNELVFLISIIPFLRGCCLLFNKKEEKNLLTKLMHGYLDEKINLTKLYEAIVGPGIISNEYIISAQDIIKHNIDDSVAISPDKYPLLHKTLMHTFTYLYLRLSVENKLVSSFGIDTSKHQQLSNIITESFKGGTGEVIQRRVFFLSRKTLLNEFNHFEMDMNIFQPAIDITNQALIKEKEQIMEMLSSL